MTDKIALVPLAPGFEEIEAVTVIDVLRRGGVRVVVAGLEKGPATGSHGISLQPDFDLDDLHFSPDELDLIVLPGGMPGSQFLHDDPRLQAILHDAMEREAWVAAICAAPIALSGAGILADKTVTSYPGFEDRLECDRYVEDRVVVDGKVVTSRGPATAAEFALVLLELIVGASVAAEVAEAMLLEVPRPLRV